VFWLLSGWLTSELALYERVDLIFSLTPPIAMGIWPSDHASVTAKLTY
jgi:hypothetical protein